MTISILVPVYNERTLVERSLQAVVDAPLPEDLKREIIVVDDCSTDGTSAILEELARRYPAIRLVRHAVNQGKGAAVRTALSHATGDFCLIQDADLEYDPNDYPQLLRPLLDGHADAVFGSRYLAGSQRRVLPFWHSLINRSLTRFSNMFCNLDLTDMETCYKAFRTDLLKSIPIRSNRFGIEPELAMKCAKRKLRIYEVPISYHGRTYAEGKKIGWRDGIRALAATFYFWFVDDLYAQPYGRAYLNNLTGTPQYVNWIVDLLRPALGDRVLEISAGIGTLSARLRGRRLHYVCAERDPLYLHALRNRFLRTPNVEVRFVDPADPSTFPSGEPAFDSVLGVNVLEYLPDPAACLRAAAQCLAPGGRLILLVPQIPLLYGSLDRTLGHRARFRSRDLESLLAAAGFVLERRHSLNRIAAPVWLIHSRLFRTRHVSKPALKVFDKTVWLWRRLDRLWPWPGLSLILIARKA